MTDMRTEITHSPLWDFTPNLHHMRHRLSVARHQELADENDNKSRACDIILHGVNESESTGKDAMKKFNEDYAALELGPIYRLGKPDPNKKRPIKLAMNNVEDKQQVMGSLKNLKNKEDFRGLSVTDDYKMTERQIIKIRWKILK